jgi:hypothetical protein
MSDVTMIDEEAFQDWLTSPLVKRAVKRAGDHAGAVDVLETLHEMMLDLEERAPGVPFHELFDACRTATVYNEGDLDGNEHLGLGTLEARRAVGRAAKAAGMTDKNLDTIFGNRKAWGPGPGANQPRKAEDHPALPLYRAGWTYKQIAAELGCGVSRVSQVITRAKERGHL